LVSALLQLCIPKPTAYLAIATMAPRGLMPFLLPHTILMIDDDPQHLQIKSWILSQAGFRIVTEVVGRNSLSVPEQGRPAADLLDYRLSNVLTS
jgi:hypothetical protein